MIGLLRPTDTIAEKDVDRGMHVLMFDGIASQIMASLTMGVFLVAFALALGASNKVIGLLAALGPILAGLVGDWFADKQLSLDLAWIAGESEPWQLPAMSLKGLDFLFIFSFFMGLYSLQRLAAVREEGEVEEEIVRAELFSEVRRSVRQVSTAGGLRYLTYFPFALLSGAISVTTAAATGLGLRRREGPAEEKPPGEGPSETGPPEEERPEEGAAEERPSEEGPPQGTAPQEGPPEEASPEGPPPGEPPGKETEGPSAGGGAPTPGPGPP